MLLGFGLLPADNNTGKNAKHGSYSLSAARATFLAAGCKASSRSAKMSLGNMLEEAPGTVYASQTFTASKQADQSQAQSILAPLDLGVRGVMMVFLVWIGQIPSAKEGNSSWEGNLKYSVAAERTGFLPRFPALLSGEVGYHKNIGVGATHETLPVCISECTIH